MAIELMVVENSNFLQNSCIVRIKRHKRWKKQGDYIVRILTY